MTDVQPIRVRVRAPRIFVFQCLSTFDRSSPVWLQELEPEVLSHDGNTLLVRFRHRTMGRVVAGVARVRLMAPDRIVQELLEGSVGALRESVVLETETDATTMLVWSAEVDLRLRVGARLLERALVTRMLRSEARATLDRCRVTIEAAALATGVVEVSS